MVFGLQTWCFRHYCKYHAMLERLFSHPKSQDLPRLWDDSATAFRTPYLWFVQSQNPAAAEFWSSSWSVCIHQKPTLSRFWGSKGIQRRSFSNKRRAKEVLQVATYRNFCATGCMDVLVTSKELTWCRQGLPRPTPFMQIWCQVFWLFHLRHAKGWLFRKTTPLTPKVFGQVVRICLAKISANLQREVGYGERDGYW